jgi:hypothetical protein
VPIAALRFRVNVLGALALAAYAAMALLSYVQAPALWGSRKDVPHANAFFRALAEQIPAIELHKLFAGNGAVIISHFVPLGLATLAALLLAGILMRRGGAADDSIVTLVLRWSIAFAVVMAFAFPLFTQDFWLSAAWGRMVAAAENPYHRFFTPHSLEGLPLDHFPMAMSYGPAWALLSGAVMAVAGKSLIATAILFKAILGAAWIAALILVARITAARPAAERCLALAFFGWIPIGVMQTTAEGHNDILMAWAALLWLYLLARGHGAAPVALAASVLSKYVTAPLFLVDAVAALRLHKLSIRRFVLRYVAPGLIGLGVVAVFFRSMQFFDGTRLVNEWRFLMPRDALSALEDVLDVSLFPAEYLIAALFAFVAAASFVALYRQPSAEAAAKAALAIMCAISFALVGHIWPWYLVWILGLAAVIPSWWLSRFVIGVAILVPFTIVAWWVDSLDDEQDWAAFIMYGGAVLWAALTRARVAVPAPAAAVAPGAEQAVESSFGRS